MAAAILSPPGSDYGPCERECGHRDCQATRELAAEVCRICKITIGYETRFYREQNHPEGGKLVHGLCLENEIDVERAGVSAGDFQGMRDRIRKGLDAERSLEDQQEGGPV